MIPTPSNDDGSYCGVSDEKLAEMCREDPDNMDIISALIKRYMPLIRKKAAQYENPRISAEDLAQEAMLAFIKAAERYDTAHHAEFSAYAYSCVNNRMISVMRKVNTRTGESLSGEITEEAPDNTTPETIFMERELLSELSALLSPKELDIFRRCIDGVSYREIAAELCITEKAVDNGVQRIRKKLKAALL